VPEQAVIREANLHDLDELVRLEGSGFKSSDQFSREQLRYLLSRANATTFVIEEVGKVMGAAIMLWRRNSFIGRMYSLVVDPAFQGRGLGSKLMRSCEESAIRRGCKQLSLEVRADNERAMVFYKRHDYKVTETLPGFYADGANGLRMVKTLEDRGPADFTLEVPYYAQTLDFTCGPACLMMAMKYFTHQLALNRSLELMLWKEATLIFMTSGIGGCGPFGLAVAAERRGYQSRVILSDQRTPFLSSVRDQEKKDVIRLVHEQLKEEAESLGTISHYYNFTFEDIAQSMRGGAIPIVLISTYRLHKVKAPHWVIITGFDNRNVYFHDPYEGFYLDDKRQAQHLRIPIPEFRKMRRYGKNVQKSVVFISENQAIVEG
jgi:ribosomal protein S18 acetylase RimI-like enzyme/predicted double-glycine peptidase